MPSESSIESKGVSREKGSEYKSLPVRVLPRDKTHRVYIDTYQSRCFIAVGSCCSRDWEVLQSDLLSVDWRSRKASAWFSLSQIRWDLGGGWRGWSKAQEPGGPESFEQEMWASQLKLGVDLLSLCLSVQLRAWTTQDPEQDPGVMLDPTGEGSLLDAVCWCNPNLFWRCPYRHTRKSNVLLSIGASP